MLLHSSVNTVQDITKAMAFVWKNLPTFILQTFFFSWLCTICLCVTMDTRDNSGKNEFLEKEHNYLRDRELFPQIYTAQRNTSRQKRECPKSLSHSIVCVQNPEAVVWLEAALQRCIVWRCIACYLHPEVDLSEDKGVLISLHISWQISSKNTEPLTTHFKFHHLTTARISTESICFLGIM